MDLEKILSEEGVLSGNLKDYEFRPCQMDMALAVERSLCEKNHILIEAPTGTGKSFAYLVPLIFYSLKEKQIVLVSTYTKSLQQQMTEIDLPFLQNIFNKNGQPFSFGVFYGANNYLCRSRLDDFMSDGWLPFGHEERILEWIDHTSTGLRMETDLDVPDHIWSRIHRDAEVCMRKKCRYFKDCFYYNELEKLSNVNIIVCNHHLLFAHIASHYSILPSFNVLTLDEAHQLENVAFRFFAVDVSEHDLYITINAIGGLLKEAEENKAQELKQHSEKIKKQAEIFFNGLKARFTEATRIMRNSEPYFSYDLYHQLETLWQFFRSWDKRRLSLEEDEVIKLELYIEKLSHYLQNLKIFLDHNRDDLYYWIEFQGIKQYCHLRFVPLDISSLIREYLFDHFSCAILTSATLSTDHNFEFIRSRLGLDRGSELILSSPFDYNKQMMLFIDPKVPSPLEYNNYLENISERIVLLLESTRGRAFVLFTSYRTLYEVKERIEDKIEYTVLAQNDKPSSFLLQDFKDDVHSVLFGTLSFWQGIDVRGEALSAVIITRLPFDVPEDPYVAARIERIEQAGGNPFLEFQLPNAAILLKQGFGRLIRGKNDRGVVAILDSRIARKQYGQHFMNSLPECPVTSSIEDIIRFFNDA